MPRRIASSITSKGQVTVPAEVRRHLGVGARERIVFIVEDDGEVRVEAERYPTIASLAGAAGTLDRPMSWREMREIAREDHAAEVLGIER